MSAPTASPEADFSARFGGRPDGVWIAPGRVNLIGEHTDHSDGFVLPIAIDRHATVTARRRADGVLRVASAQLGEGPDIAVVDLEPGPMHGWWAYVHGVAWALREIGVAVPGADLLVDSTVPAGAGLSSSAALEVAVGLALVDLGDATIDGRDLALAAVRGEREWTATPCGVMDQLAAALGRAGHALLIDTRSLEVEQIPFELAGSGLRVVVIDTRVAHAHAGGEYAARTRECRRAAEILGAAALRDATLATVDDAAARLGELLHRRARHVVTENARVIAAAELLRAGRLRELGPLFAASHESLRRDFEVSVPELDTAVRAALAAGATASRMTGGGFGGSVVALVDADLVPTMQAAVHAEFVAAGFAAPAMFVVGTSDGARRVR